MPERETHISAPIKRRSTFLLRKVVPHSWTINIADKLLGEGLSEEGHKILKSLLAKMLKGERVSASRDLPMVFADSKIQFFSEGEENIPPSGATLYAGNHTRGLSMLPLREMSQYFVAARAIYNRRVDVSDDELREPVAIAQRGLTRVIRPKIGKFSPGVKFVFTYPFTPQFYDLAADALGWATVKIPKFSECNEEEKQQIKNRQKLPGWVIDKLNAGGAILWFPQGTHRDHNNLTMPDKSEGFLKRLYSEDIKLVAMRFLPLKKIGPKGEDNTAMGIFFSEAVHISDLPINGNGLPDMKSFVKRFMEPLGEKKFR